MQTVAAYEVVLFVLASVGTTVAFLGLMEALYEARQVKEEGVYPIRQLAAARTVRNQAVRFTMLAELVVVSIVWMTLPEGVALASWFRLLLVFAPTLSLGFDSWQDQRYRKRVQDLLDFQNESDRLRPIPRPGEGGGNARR